MKNIQSRGGGKALSKNSLNNCIFQDWPNRYHLKKRRAIFSSVVNVQRLVHEFMVKTPSFSKADLPPDPPPRSVWRLAGLLPPSFFPSLPLALLLSSSPGLSFPLQSFPPDFQTL